MDAHIGDKDDDETDLMNEAHLCMMQERLMQMDCFFVFSKVKQASVMKSLQTSH